MSSLDDFQYNTPSNSQISPPLRFSTHEEMQSAAVPKTSSPCNQDSVRPASTIQTMPLFTDYTSLGTEIEIQNVNQSFTSLLLSTDENDQSFLPLQPNLPIPIQDEDLNFTMSEIQGAFTYTTLKPHCNREQSSTCQVEQQEHMSPENSTEMQKQQYEILQNAKNPMWTDNQHNSPAPELMPPSESCSLSDCIHGKIYHYLTHNSVIQLYIVMYLNCTLLFHMISSLVVMTKNIVQ